MAARKAAKEAAKPARKSAAASAGPVASYFARLEPEQREALERIRRAILAAAPGAVEGLSYGMPAFKLGGKGIAGVAAFKDHLSYFPMSGTLLDAVPEAQGFQTSKGTLQFTPDRPLPQVLVRKLVKARIAEVRAGAR